MKLTQPHVKYACLIFCSLLMCLACKKEPAVTKEKPIPFSYDIRNDTVIHGLIALEQVGDIDEIDTYLTHHNPTYRFQALKSYTSPRYPDRLNKIHALLNDTVGEVRQRAIYAVGQQANKQSIPLLIEQYDAWDSLKLRAESNALVLEAIGKCGARNELELLASIKTFDPADSVLIRGQSLGIFQLLLKGIYDDAAVDKMAEYFFSPQYGLGIRQIAGYYLMRGRDLNLSQHEFALEKILRSDDDYSLRAYAASIISNAGSQKYANTLADQLKREKNDLVKINILRAILKMPYSRVKSVVYNEIDNENPQISRMAARFFLLKGQPDDAAQYWDKVKTRNLDIITTANFAAATAKNLPFYYALTRNSAVNWIVSRLKSSDDPYIKSQLLGVLAELPEQARHIVDQYKPDAHPVVKSQTIFAIQTALQRATADRKYINTVNAQARKLFDLIIQDQDIGALAAMSYVVRDTASTNLHSLFRRQAQLKPLLDSLSLPAELETYNEIAMLLNSYGDASVSKVKAEKVKRFDFSKLKNITGSTSATITTSRGSITMELYPEESPISVLNFIELSEAGYFDNKIFHRVVPNFVIQTGCHRGDGYGSQDYVIRSELGPMQYDRAGKVGMASAGIDTESSQWFVTHLPVFHLSGRYTIFAQVTRGIDIVNKINVGDRIEKVEIQY